MGNEQRQCRFCAIIRGEVPSVTVYADDAAVAFLDHRPLFPGHILLVPRRHIMTLADLPGTLVMPLFTGAQLLARAVEEAMEAEGTFIAINNRVSQSVPHLHIHIVPRRRHDGLKGFFWPRHTYHDEAEVCSVAAQINAAINRLKKQGGKLPPPVEF
jgi:histidine triad (HIT) family protein